MVSPFAPYKLLVYPVFMGAALGAAILGSLFAGLHNPFALLLFEASVFSALYLAHLKDSYIDYYARHEDAWTPLSQEQYRSAMAISAGVCIAAAIALFPFYGFPLLAVQLAALAIAWLHAPVLDLNPIGATAGYPTGLILAFLGGHLIQAPLTPSALVFAAAGWVVLNGVKVVDDIKDYAWDKSFGKRAAPVALGKDRAKVVGVGLVVAGSLAGIVASLLGWLPLLSALAFASLLPFARISLRQNARSEGLHGLFPLLQGTYAFLVIEGAILLLNL